MTREAWNASLLEKGLIDDRYAYTMSNLKNAPNGAYGMVLLCVCGEVLSVFDTDFSGQPGKLLYRLTLSELKNVKIRTFPLMPSLKFDSPLGKFSFSAGFAAGLAGPEPPISGIFKKLAGK